MKIILIVPAAVAVLNFLAPAARPDAATLPASAPLHFEPAPAGGFVTRGLRFASRIEGNQMEVRAGGQTMRLRFERSLPGAGPLPGDRLRSVTSVVKGRDATKWQTAVPNYGQLSIHNLYPGVDLTYYGNAGELEYDLAVAPGANPEQVRLRIDGVKPRIDSAGNLLAGAIQKKPVTYQTGSGGARIPVQSSYHRNADGTFGFVLGPYDHHKLLVIDPVLTYSTYLAGSLQDIAYGIGHDAQGFLYVAGTTYSTDFTLAGDSQQTAETGDLDLFVAKIDPNQPPDSQLVYSTYLGGATTDTLHAMTVSPKGQVFLAGTTTSSDFPIVNGARTTLDGTSDAFIAVVDPSQPSGSALIYSTYLGGASDDGAYAISVDPAGKIYVTGTTNSTDFPTVNYFQSSLDGVSDAFVAGVDPSQSGSGTLIFSTYLGGGSSDDGRGVAAASDGTIWVTGDTFSSDFPIAGNSYQPNYGYSGDVFLAHLDPSLGTSGLLYSTFLGGSSEEVGRKVIVDSTGRVVVAGFTASANFPVTAGALQPTYAGETDGFVAVLNPTASTTALQLVYSTFYGGSHPDAAYDVTEDSSGLIYVTGYTGSADLPVSADAMETTHLGGDDAFVLKLNPKVAGLNGMDYSSYIASDGAQIGYAIDVDAKGNIYVAGSTSGPIFGGLGGVAKPTSGGNIDAFVFGFSACSFSISLDQETFPAQGGSDTISISASTDCGWTAASAVDWVKVSPARGSANGMVTITVAANTTGASRTGTLTIAGQAFTVTQSQ